MPIVCIESPGDNYWSKWIEFVRTAMLGRSLISPRDLSLVRITNSVDTAVDEVTRFYSNYDSMR